MRLLLIALPLLFLLGCAPSPPTWVRTHHVDPGTGGGETTEDPGTTTEDPTTPTDPGTTTPTADPGGACISATFCEYPVQAAECTLPSYGDACPSQGLIGCCGDYVPAGGYWDCYYPGSEAAADAAKASCTMWRTEVP